MWLWQAIQIIGSTIWTMIKALFSLLPVFDEISGLQDQIIAAALGVPVAVIAVVGILIKIGRAILKRA